MRIIICSIPNEDYTIHALKITFLTFASVEKDKCAFPDRM